MSSWEQQPFSGRAVAHLFGLDLPLQNLLSKRLTPPRYTGRRARQKDRGWIEPTTGQHLAPPPQKGARSFATRL
jgi:hypothetical protein